MPTAPLYTTYPVCRVCGGPFDPLLDLGSLVLSDYLPPTAPDPPSAPLDLVVCQRCDLVQLRHSVDRGRLYPHYWYQSAVNESMVAELQDIVQTALRITGPLTRHAVVVDVGANDGTLLKAYADQLAGVVPLRVAVEPSRTFRDRLADHADVVITNYFPSTDIQGMPGKSVSILTSIAMFYDLDDPLSFVREVDRLLAPDGVWIVQMQDLAQMVAATGYDNICFEHRCYYSTATFVNLFRGTDLYVHGVETRAINGGSLRYIIRRRPSLRPTLDIQTQLGRESWLTRDALDHFAYRVGAHRTQLRATIAHLRSTGRPVDLYAASTKSSTLLQYCGLDHSVLRCAVERSPDKIGLVTSGTRIPIVGEATWRLDPAPATVVGAWGFKASFLAREQRYLADGGSFLFPLPGLEVVTRGR